MIHATRGALVAGFCVRLCVADLPPRGRRCSTVGGKCRPMAEDTTKAEGKLASERRLRPDCFQYMQDQSCDWTADWSCPGQETGKQGEASDDETTGYQCCCTYGMWKADPFQDEEEDSAPSADLSEGCKDGEEVDGSGICALANVDGAWLQQQCCVPSKATKAPPKACCKAMTKECLACSEGVSVEDFCLKNEGRYKCPAATTTASPEPEATKAPPKACCLAMTKECLACKRGVSVEQFCLKNEGKYQCPRDAPDSEVAESTTEAATSETDAPEKASEEATGELGGKPAKTSKLTEAEEKSQDLGGVLFRGSSQGTTGTDLAEWVSLGCVALLVAAFLRRSGHLSLRDHHMLPLEADSPQE